MDIKLECEDEIFQLNYIAKQSDSSILYKKGKLVLLVSIAIDNKVVDEDFLPLTVQYIEKSYANGKIPSGYVKRESRPSDFETLTSRLIDRSIRPLFPKDFKYCTQIIIMVLSIDSEIDIQVSALNAVGAALYLSSIPVFKIVSGVRVANIEGNFIINPDMTILEKSSIDFFISGENDNLLMLEFKSSIDSLDENSLLNAVSMGQTYIKNKSLLYKSSFQSYVKDKLSIDNLVDDNLIYLIKEEHKLQLESYLSNKLNQNIINDLIKSIVSKFNIDESRAKLLLNTLKQQYMRNKILYDNYRFDGRGLKDIRNIEIETNILPNAHGSALFTRGETQVLSVCTIGGDNDMQSYDILSSKKSGKEKFMLHYNFLPFCTGETYPLGAVSRRELGHGNLAKKALESSINDEIRTIRIVSEVLESNGSSSMASVCSGSLSLYGAGLRPSFLVAGIAIGLVTDGNIYKILNDITGIEDNIGDMDCKIAGNKDGITALQMDVKIDGFNINIFKDVLLQAREALFIILNKMEEARDKIILGANTPLYESFTIPINKISSLIGQGGRNIKQITTRFGVNIDINKDKGIVNIFGTSKKDLLEAKEHILSCIYICLDSFNIGDKFNGKVKRITDFGVFVELKDGIDGLIHNSKLDANNIFKEGDFISVEIIVINDNKIELSVS